MPIMLRELENSRQLAECREYVIGFCDSSSALKTAFPGKPSYKLGVLYREICDKNFNDNNALDDVQALAEIFGNAEIEETVISANTLTIGWAMEYTRKNNKLRLEVAKLEETFNNKTNKVVSHSMARKICESGLNYNLLKLAFERNRENGIKLLLSEKRQIKYKKKVL